MICGVVAISRINFRRIARKIKDRASEHQQKDAACVSFPAASLWFTFFRVSVPSSSDPSSGEDDFYSRPVSNFEPLKH